MNEDYARKFFGARSVASAASSLKRARSLSGVSAKSEKSSKKQALAEARSLLGADDLEEGF